MKLWCPGETIATLVGKSNTSHVNSALECFIFVMFQESVCSREFSWEQFLHGLVFWVFFTVALWTNIRWNDLDSLLEGARIDSLLDGARFTAAMIYALTTAANIVHCRGSYHATLKCSIQERINYSANINIITYTKRPL